jgi:pyridoxamine 5'-phosphate oxidase
MSNIADIRNEFSKSSLHISTVSGDPVDQFNRWFDEALKSEVPEVNAMSLATINQHNRPSNRIVLLKGIENRKFVFYTNYQSAKGKDLEINSACALTFFWPELERQVRIEGNALRVDEGVSDAYFQSRPRGSQIGAWSSPQSTIIKSSEILMERVKKIEDRFEGQDTLPRPRQWGGYAVDPFLIEFWQGRPNRLHDRVLYTLIDNKWKINLLAP